MLSFFVSISIIATAFWLTMRNILRLCRSRAGWHWWIAFAATLICGGYIGWQLSGCDVQVSPTFVWGGLPLPLGFFHLEDGQWVDYVPERPVQLCNKLADVVIPIILLLLVGMAVRRPFLRVFAPESLIPNP
jgi:hypothetical protein